MFLACFLANSIFTKNYCFSYTFFIRMVIHCFSLAQNIIYDSVVNVQSTYSRTEFKSNSIKICDFVFFNAEAANKYSINFCLRALMNNIFAIFFAVIIFLIKHRTNHSNVRCQICIQYNIYCQLKFWRHFTKCYRLQLTGC